MPGDSPRWMIRVLPALIFLVLAGCNLPYPGPYRGRVTDAQTGQPISGAKVEAEWWCHDNPLPDGPGSYFIRSWTVTNDRGAFRLEKETRRGGLFGSHFVLRISAEGYIPAHLIAEPSGTPLPAGTEEYPFTKTSAYKVFPAELKIKLTPAVPVFLKALRSGVPLQMKIAREKLIRLLGVDYRYDPDKWEEALKFPRTSSLERPDKGLAEKRPGCPCPESIDKFKRPRELRRKVRKLLKAAAFGRMEEVKILLDAGVDCNARNYACRTPLMKAAGMGRVSMVRFLLSKGADVNAKDDNCRTPLMRAASMYGSSEIVALLLSHGADVNARDKDGVTALMSASLFGYADTTKILVSNGADVNVKDKDGETAWFKAAVVSHSEVMRILEMQGAKR